MSISRGPARKVTVDSAKLVSTTTIPSAAASRLIGKRLSVFDRLGENHVKHQENGDNVISQERKISLSVARCQDSDDIMSEKKKEISFTMKKKNGNLEDSDKVLKKQKKVDTGTGEASPLKKKKKKEKTKDESAQEGTQLQSSVQQATKNDSEGEIRKKVDTKKKKKTVEVKPSNDEKDNTQEVKANKKNKNVKAKDGTKKQDNQSTKGGAKKLVEYVSEESDIEVEKKKKKKLKKGKELKSPQEKKTKKGCDSEDEEKSSKKKKKKKNKAVSDYEDTDDDESSHETHTNSKNKKRERSQSWTSSNSDEEANTKSKKKMKNKSSDEKNKSRKFEMSPVRTSKNDATPLHSPSVKSTKKKEYSSYESASSYESDHDQRKRKKKKNKTKSEAANQQQYSRGRSASPEKKLHSNIRKRERSRSNETNERRTVKVMRYDEHIADPRSGSIDVRQHFKTDIRIPGAGYGKPDESLHSSQIHTAMMSPPIIPLQRPAFEDYEGTQQRGRVETFVDVQPSNWHEHLNRQLREGGRRRSIDPYDRVDSRLPPAATTRTVDSYPSLPAARDQSLTRDQRYVEERRDAGNQDFYRDDNRRRDVNNDVRGGDFREGGREGSDNWNQTSGYSETQCESYQQQERNNSFDTRGDFRGGREGTATRGGANQNRGRRENFRQQNQTRDTNRDSGRDFESSYNNDDRFNQRDGNYQNDTQTGQYQQNQFDQRRAYNKDDNSGDRERGNNFRNNNRNQAQNQNRMNTGRHHHQMYDNLGKLRFSLSPIRDKLVSDSIEERLQSDNEDDDKNKKKNASPEKDSKTEKSEKNDKILKSKVKKEEKKEEGSGKLAESEPQKKKVEKTDKKSKKIDKEKEKEKDYTDTKIVSNADKGSIPQKVSQKVDKPDAANDNKSSTTNKKKDKKSTKDKEVKKDVEAKTSDVSSIKNDKPVKVKKENLKKEDTLENKETKDSTEKENKGVPTELLSSAPLTTITDNKSEKKKEKSDESKIDSKSEKESKKERKDRTKERNERESSVSSKRSVSSRDGKRERSVERGRKRSPDSKRGKSPTETKKARNKSADRAGSRRGRSTERRDNWRSHNSPNVRNSPASRRETDSTDRKRRGRSSECGSERGADEKKTHDRGRKDESTTKEGNANKKIDNMLNDVYESISDEELDLFDDDDLEVAPVPASVIDIDWGMMASLASSKKKESEDNSQMPAYRRNLTPGAILSEIGFSANLLSAATLKAVQEKVLEANNLTREGLAPSEQHILDHGTAAMTQTCFRRRRAHEDLLKRRLVDVIGMRNDLEVRRDLRKPLDKVGSRFDTFCVPPTIPADAEMFITAAALYRKKPQVEGDPVYVTIPSKVGSLVMCKS